MSVREDRLKFVLDKVAEKLGLQNYNFTFSGINEKIENYFGVLIPITLVEETQDGKVYKNVIMKFPPSKKELRDAGVLDYLYAAEVFVYTVLLPNYKRLSKFDISELFPEYYYSDLTRYDEVIVLKDMCCEGFNRYRSNKRFLDLDHIIVSLKSLAQFHALFMIFQNEPNDKIEKQARELSYSSNHPPGLLNTLKNSLHNHLCLFQNTNHVAFFNMLDANFDTIVNNSLSKVKCLVYGHGDIWKENILYKYEDNKPIKACLLDYQSTRLLCPAQDVLGFLLTSTQGKVRRNFYEHFLSTYYDYLQQTLLDHRLDPVNIYSRTDFNNDLKIVAPYCFITTNMAFSLWLGLEEKALLKSKNNLEEKQKKNVISYYKKIMLDITEDFVTFGYIKS